MQRIRRRDLLVPVTGLIGAVLARAAFQLARGQGQPPSQATKREESGAIDRDYTVEGEFTIPPSGPAALSAKELARRIEASARREAAC
ncbi:MAG TPA: hypothetical protein QGF05_14915 [Dehalococcoidia bacterium]|nr:hypothetical protein [Dehalococcoidia bacterium]